VFNEVPFVTIQCDSFCSHRFVSVHTKWRSRDMWYAKSQRPPLD